MKSVIAFSLLILVASMAMLGGGMTSSIFADDETAILLDIAKRAQEQIHNQISDESSDEVKRLLEEGTQNVDALEKAVQNDEVDSAKEYFFSAMKIFKEISGHLTISDDRWFAAESDSVEDTEKDPSNDLHRLQAYVNSLKTIAKNHNTTVDFTELDSLFAEAKNQINDQQFEQAIDTLREIKEMVVKVDKQIREEAAKQESQRAKEYAQRYIEQLDRLIEHAKKQGVAAEIIEKLEIAREHLHSTDNPKEIVKEIKKIMLLKDQFELTENDGLESKVLQVEKTISRLSQIEEVDLDDLADAKDTLQSIKQYLSEGEFDTADDLLVELVAQLEEIQSSVPN